MPTLILIRGLPGSGKSTLAKLLTYAKKPYCTHLETDMYFTSLLGVYNFQKEKLKEAHEWCQRQTLENLIQGRDVVVSNTFTQRWEALPYAQICKDYHFQLQVLSCHGNFRNEHGVGEEHIQKMADRWEHFTVEDLLK